MKPVLLLVEDDPTSHAFLKAATEALAVDVDGAVSMQAALALAGDGRYAAWLIDANLPDGSGIALLQQLRALGLPTPALAHTAAREPADLQRLRDAGFDAAVAKPLSATDWQAAVSRLLQGQAGDPRRTQMQAAPPASMTETLPSSEPPVWDDAAALLALKGHQTHVDALRGLFLAELPVLLEQITQAGAHHAPEVARSALHKLSASCGFVGARRLGATIPALQAAPDSDRAREALSRAAHDTLAEGLPAQGTPSPS